MYNHMWAHCVCSRVKSSAIKKKLKWSTSTPSAQPVWCGSTGPGEAEPVRRSVQYGPSHRSSGWGRGEHLPQQTPPRVSRTVWPPDAAATWWPPGCSSSWAQVTATTVIMMSTLSTWPTLALSTYNFFRHAGTDNKESNAHPHTTCISGKWD